MVTNVVSQEDRHILLSVAVKKTKLFTVSTDARLDLLALWCKRWALWEQRPGSRSLPADETYVLLTTFLPILDHWTALSGFLPPVPSHPKQWNSSFSPGWHLIKKPKETEWHKCNKLSASSADSAGALVQVHEFEIQISLRLNSQGRISYFHSNETIQKRVQRSLLWKYMCRIKE